MALNTIAATFCQVVPSIDGSLLGFWHPSWTTVHKRRKNVTHKGNRHLSTMNFPERLGQFGFYANSDRYSIGHHSRSRLSDSCRPIQAQEAVGARGSPTGGEDIVQLNLTDKRIEVQDATDQKVDIETQDEDSTRRMLRQLDQQLEILSSGNVIPERRLNESVSSGDPKRRPEPSQWPELPPEFFAITGIGLLLLTVVNNVLYRIFLGTPFVPRNQLFKTSVIAQPRFRVTDDPERREQNELPDEIQPARAPPLSDE